MSGPVLLFLVVFGSAAACSAGATLAIRTIARAWGVVDRPGAHKAHAAPVALGGGIALALTIVSAILLALWLAQSWSNSAPSWLPASVRVHLGGVVTKTPIALALCGSVLVVCLVGFFDDLRPLSPLFRLLAETGVALVLVVGFNLRLLSHLGGACSTALSVLWIVTLINSFNLLDNMDGLAAGVAAIAASVFAVAAIREGQVFVPACCLLLAGALAGFLPFNFHRATIYLGDAGSLVIGLLLAVFTILTTFADPARGQAPIGVIAPLIVMAVPLYDTASVIVIRLRSGDPIWVGDRRHFSHRLVRRGMSVPRAVLVIWLATLATSLPALLLPSATWPVACGILAQTVLVVALVALLESAGPRDQESA